MGAVDEITEHQAQSVHMVVSLMDPAGNTGTSLRESFIIAATAGLCPAAALRDGLALLVRLGFVTVDEDFYRAAPSLALLQVAELTSVRSILGEASSIAVDQDSRRIREEVGLAAELHIVDLCRDELCELGREDLAAGVIQVSLISDQYGYDVSAPTTGSSARCLEVKGTTRDTAGLFRFYLTRHEYNVGRANVDTWSLVACLVRRQDSGQGSSLDDPPLTASQDVSPAIRLDGGVMVELLGYCTAEVLAPFVPQDANGRWTEAVVSLPRHLLRRGLPTPIH